MVARPDAVCNVDAVVIHPGHASAATAAVVGPLANSADGKKQEARKGVTSVQNSIGGSITSKAQTEEGSKQMLAEGDAFPFKVKQENRILRGKKTNNVYPRVSARSTIRVFPTKHATHGPPVKRYPCRWITPHTAFPNLGGLYPSQWSHHRSRSRARASSRTSFSRGRNPGSATCADDTQVEEHESSETRQKSAYHGISYLEYIWYAYRFDIVSYLPKRCPIVLETKQAIYWCNTHGHTQRPISLSSVAEGLSFSKRGRKC